jgi:hypothetical protein
VTPKNLQLRIHKRLASANTSNERNNSNHYLSGNCDNWEIKKVCVLTEKNGSFPRNYGTYIKNGTFGFCFRLNNKFPLFHPPQIDEHYVELANKKY